MLFIRFLRFIRGYVVFEAHKGFPERFVNLCRRFGILLWDLKIVDGVITAKTDCSGYKKIRTVSKRSGMKTKIVSKHGLRFFLNKHSARIGLLAGALTGAALLTILSSRLWLIDVTGNSAVSSEKIISVFEQLGIKEGAATGKIKVNEVEKEAAKLLPELSWLNINIDGCSALIEVREAAPPPQTEKDGPPSNIVAARDGILIQLRPFKGTQEQKIGSAVLKGDLLISGINQNRDLTVSFCEAEGYVVARTSHKINFTQAETLSAQVETGEKRGYILSFFGFDIPVGEIPQNGFAEEKRLCINGINLPLSLICVREGVYAEKKIKLTPQKTALLAKHKFFDICTDEFRGIEIEEAEIIQKAGTVSGSFVCLENIAEPQPMIIEEIVAEQPESN